MSIKTFWKKSVVNKLLIIIPLVWVALAIVFGIYDLEISKFLFNSNSGIVNLVENFGEIPGILFGLFAIFTLGTNLKIRKLSHRKLFFLGEILGLSFLFIYLIKIFFDYFNVNFQFMSIYGITLGLIFILISLIFFYLFNTKWDKFSKENYLFAKVGVMTFIISGVLVEALKFIWGRVRYENVLANAGNFTEWYLPQGITGNYSFPSGHAYLGWILIPLILIFMNKNKIQKWIIFGLTILFGLFVSFERVVYGAHYASDILFSSGIVIVTFLILSKRFFFEKNNLSTEKKKKIKKRK